MQEILRGHCGESGRSDGSTCACKAASSASFARSSATARVTATKPTSRPRAVDSAPRAPVCAGATGGEFPQSCGNYGTNSSHTCACSDNFFGVFCGSKQVACISLITGHVRSQIIEDLDTMASTTVWQPASQRSVQLYFHARHGLGLPGGAGRCS